MNIYVCKLYLLLFCNRSVLDHVSIHMYQFDVLFCQRVIS